MSTQPHVSMVSKPTGHPKSKQDAIASMFKAAKMTGASSAAGTSHAHHQWTASKPGIRMCTNQESCPQPCNLASAAVNGETSIQLAGPHNAGIGVLADSGAAVEAEPDTGQGFGCHAGQDHGVQMSDTAASVVSGHDMSELEAEAIGHDRVDGDDLPAHQQPSDDAAGCPTGVDLAEQKQIMHELWLAKNALSYRHAVKRPAAVNKAGSKRSKVSGKGKQTQLLPLLTKVQPP